jgi:hypothetical protein
VDLPTSAGLEVRPCRKRPEQIAAPFLFGEEAKSGEHPGSTGLFLASIPDSDRPARALQVRISGGSTSASARSRLD